MLVALLRVLTLSAIVLPMRTHDTSLGNPLFGVEFGSFCHPV